MVTYLTYVFVVRNRIKQLFDLGSSLSRRIGCALSARGYRATARKNDNGEHQSDNSLKFSLFHSKEL
jgi:hypothetical protein